MPNENRGFFERLGARRFAPGSGVTQPPPEKGLKRFLFVLISHFWKLITLNLLFLAFCIPVLTIPAAFCGMNRVLVKLYREGNCFVWTEFIKEFRANLFKSLPFGAVGGALLFASYYSLSFGTSLLSNGVEVLTTALGILILVFAVLFLNYAFVFLPTIDLKNGYIARNAFIFAVTEWKTNLIILAIVLLTALFSVLLFPYSLIAVLLLAFSFQQYVVCSAVNAPMQKRIIGPYEQRKKNDRTIENDKNEQRKEGSSDDREQ